VEPLIAFEKICRSNGVHLTGEQLGLFEKYAALLLEWNAKVNLISRKDEQNLWTSHLLHCISPMFLFTMPAEARVLDMGTGGGLPGVPLAIANPGWRVTLLDSIAKKTTAIKDIVERMGIAGVEVVNGRAEDRDVVGLRKGKFDLVIARGVAPLVELAVWSRPYLSRVATPAGTSALKPALRTPALVAYKGGDLDTEMKALRVKVPGAGTMLTDLVFTGSSESGLEEKKLVVLQFT
jgi:16S rRNA (guanine527-N7)-methyltransferase